MDGIYTMANDRMASFLESFLRSVRRVMPSVPIGVIPFDDSVQKTEQLAATYGASLVPPDLTWDLIGKNIYGDEDYRPGVPAYRYYRKFNAFTGPFQTFCFMDVNTLVLSPLNELGKRLDQNHDILFLMRSSPKRSIRRDVARCTMQILSPGILSGYNAGFFLSRRNTVDPLHAATLGRNKNLRRIFGMAPEQAFFAWYATICGLRHGLIGELDPSLQNVSSGKKFLVEKSSDGRFYFLEGPSQGRQAYFLKWTGQDAAEMKGGKNANLLDLCFSP